MKANLNRGISVFTALLIGLLVGLYAGAYVYYAWMPPDAILKNASPKYLTDDRVTNRPQYQDFYAVRAAELYHHDTLLALPVPLENAYKVLGVTTGDATLDEAIAMVIHAEQVAKIENDANGAGDVGFFTKNDELILNSLKGALQNAKTGNAAPSVDMSRYPPFIARNNARIVGLILLLLLLLVGAIIVYFVDQWVGRRVSLVNMVNPVMRGPTTVIPHERSGGTSATPANVTVNVNSTPTPTAPGSLGMASVPSASRAATPNAEETALTTFPPTIYRYGDDHYDEDFAINGSMGELLGECGVSIADRVGVDTPAKVSALSLWLFDKTDFKSTTKLLLTEEAWNDPVVRNKLKVRGEPARAMEGGVVDIETSSLRAVVQVSDLTLGADPAAGGYFQAVTLTFTVFKKTPQAAQT
jgi:hypothetical protein